MPESPSQGLPARASVRGSPGSGDDLHTRRAQALAHVLADGIEGFALAGRGVGHLEKHLELEERPVRTPRPTHVRCPIAGLAGSRADTLELLAQESG